MKLLALLPTLVLCDLAVADVNAWLAEVVARTPATYDGLSSTLMGTRNTGFGDKAAIEFEQYADSGQFGVTLAGVVDHFLAPHVVN